MKIRKSQNKKREAEVCGQLVRSMLLDHGREDITFNELISLLARHNAKFYSPDEFKKMSKLFSHPHKVEPVAVPLQHIRLHSTLDGPFPLYLISVHTKPTLGHSQLLSPFVALNAHPPDACLRCFVMQMKKRFGNQINWFKVLGGHTLSVSIATQTFQENVASVLLGSAHKKCAKSITGVFREQLAGVVSWKRFMAIVKQELKSIQRGNLNQPTLYAKSSQTIFVPSPKKSLEQPLKRSDRQSLDLTIRNQTQNRTYFKQAYTNANRFVASNQLTSTNYVTNNNNYITNNNNNYVSSSCKAKTEQSFHLLVSNKKCKIFERTHTSFSEKEQEQGRVKGNGREQGKDREQGKGRQGKGGQGKGQGEKLKSKSQSEGSSWNNRKKMSVFFQQNNKSCYV